MIPDTQEISYRTADAIVEAFRGYLKEFGVSQADFAHQTGASQTNVSVLLNDYKKLPPKTRDELLREVNNWMEENFRERLAKRPDNFVLTAAAKLMMSAARNTKIARVIGVVTGPAGLGKSLSLDAIAAQLPGTMVVTIDYDSKSASGLLNKIYNASRLRRQKRARVQLADVVDRLGGSGRLLAVDQAHDASDNAIKLLMQLHDAADLPVLLVGTVDVHKRLTDDNDPQFGQFSSRIGLRCDLLAELFNRGRGGRSLQWILVDEVRRIFEREKVKFHPDAASMLCRIANFEVGHLRRVRNLVRIAEALAKGRDGAGLILRVHVEQALRFVTGEARPMPPGDSERVDAHGGTG